MKANYHTHTKLCNHATGDVEDYVKAAIEFNFEEIGMSDHNPIPREFMSKKDYYNNWLERNMQMSEYRNIYLKQLDAVVEKYKGKIKILRGLECEFIPSQIKYYEQFRSELDYLNLGMHFFINNEGIVVNSYSEVDYRNVLEYATACAKALDTKLFKILVHPDLFMFNYKDEFGKRRFDEKCVEATHIIIQSAIKNGVYLEINANGISNSEKYSTTGDWLYPDKNFWMIANTYKEAMIIIGSDAHNPNDILNDNVLSVINFAKKIGINLHEKIKI